MRLVAIYPADGEGEDCDADAPDDCGVPVNATLTLRFDRYLDPGSVNRQAIRVFTGDPDFSPSIPFDVDYDPIERVARFRMPRGYSLTSRAVYRLELVVPQSRDDFGIRAFDGAPISDEGLPLAVSFLTGAALVDEPRPEAPSCETIVSLLLRSETFGNCASSECHRRAGSSSGGAPEGLWLDTPTNFRLSAIGRVAHETELGDRAGVALEDGVRFGVQMPLIDPKSPGNSYLVYKLLRQPRNFEPCDVDSRQSELCAEPADPCETAYPEAPLPEGECLPPSEEESTRLREWFVRGEPMPLQRGASRSVTLQGLRALGRFIAAGADCSE